MRYYRVEIFQYHTILSYGDVSIPCDNLTWRCFNNMRYFGMVNLPYRTILSNDNPSLFSDNTVW